MQANCLVFPSPKHYNLQSIQHDIVLIPRASHNNRHALYCPSAQLSFRNPDLFEDYLISASQPTLPKRQKVLSKSGTKTEDDKQDTGVIQGSWNIKEKVSSEDYVPCLFLGGERHKLILFFHANGEDLTSAYDFLKLLNHQTKYPILAMEYRGYSLYQGESTPQNIETDACRVVQFLQANHLTSSQLILSGRSIGCAIALAVTKKYSTHSAVLLSPFISLKKIARDMYGSCAEAMIKEAFDNEEICRQITCPLLIIHGEKDALVPYQHSLQLLSRCQSYCRLKVVENMTHTKFNFRLDFITHFAKFMRDLE